MSGPVWIRERGQASIEAIFVIPVMLLCAWASIDAGLLVRDRIMVAQAAGAAGAAVARGDDSQSAAVGAVAANVRGEVEVVRHGDRVDVSIPAGRGPVRLALGERVSSSVVVDVEGGAR